MICSLFVEVIQKKQPTKTKTFADRCFFGSGFAGCSLLVVADGTSPFFEFANLSAEENWLTNDSKKNKQGWMKNEKGG